MQYLRERLSLNLNVNQPAAGSDEERVPEPQDDPPQRPARRVREVPNSPTYSHFSEASEKGVASTYATPYQSPVASEKWSEHNRSNVPGHPLVVQLDNPNPSRPVFVIDNGQFGGYHHPNPIQGGYVNHAYTTDGVTPNSTNQAYPNRPQPPPVVREQYWTWSCKCRQYTSREKVLLLVICFLLLVIGGLSAYVAIISDNGNPLQGGLLTPGGLSQMTIH
uniref:Putative conserved plasma membrane protein n=1 Tax=Culex tarsalis TaxID=7177 RepID=A0A1Q3FI88_CULTA